MPDLVIALAGLLFGPIAYRLCQRREEIYGFLDGFVLVGVAGLVLSEVLPESIQKAGPAAIGLALLGFSLPFLLERRLALLPFSPNAFFRWLMVFGLVLHQLLDGVALSKGMGQTSLRLAVVLHQVPKGFFIWGMAGASTGRRLGILMIGGLCLATAGGYLLGDELLATLVDRPPLWLFQAFIGGGLLHVIVHHVPWRARGHCDSGCAPGAHLTASRKLIVWSGVGALFSFLGLMAMSFLPSAGHHGADGEPVRVSAAFLRLAVESAPSILLGFVAAGIFQAFLPKVLFSWLGGRGRMSQALRGIAIGVPLPICSCGVAPVYLSLLKKSVPPAAALAFLIATPEIGIDSIFLSGKLLGLEITLIRLCMAFLIALCVAMALARTFEKIQSEGDLDHLSLPPERPLPPTFRGKAAEAIRFGGSEIVDHTGAWLLVGLVVAALLEPYLDPAWLERIPKGMDVLLFSLLGLPLYVCASGATPLAAVLLHKGASTGAVLAFLITGPSTNVTTFGILKRYHGTRGAVLFAAAVCGFSVTIGFAINWLFPGSSAPIGKVLAEPEHGAVAWASSVVLLALFAGSLLRLGPRGFLATLSETLGGLPSRPHSHEHHDHDHDHDHDHHHHEHGHDHHHDSHDHGRPASGTAPRRSSSHEPGAGDPALDGPLHRRG